MTYFVNLSTIHDYSIDETVDAFVQICNLYNDDSYVPYCFQNLINYLWVAFNYQVQYGSLIEPYKLGRITTDEFLDNLSQICRFMNDNNRKELLAGAWTASIKMSDEKLDRLQQLLELAEQEPVYLISNTNELDVLAIFDLLKKVNPDLSFQNRDLLLMGNSDQPVEILPNIFLCVSYQLGAFKADNTTPGLIEHLSKDALSPKLISQFNGDKQKAEQLGFTVIEPDEFFADQNSYSLSTL